jgi:prevent-host-death family protein
MKPKDIIGAGEFKVKCLHILDEVYTSRREIVITKRGKPVARLLPADDAVVPSFGRMKGSAEVLGDLIAPIGDEWDADA